MFSHTAAALAPDSLIVVTGHGADAGRGRDRRGERLRFVRQMPQHGTGHAVQQAVPALHDSGTTLILNGDVPLIERATARALVAACGGERLALLTVELDDPGGYGRIVRDAATAASAASSSTRMQARSSAPSARSIPA